MTRRGQTDDDHVKTETGHGHWYDDDREDDTRDRTDTTDKHDGLRGNRARTHRQQGQRNTDCNGLKTWTTTGHLPLSSGPFVSRRPLHSHSDLHAPRPQGAGEQQHGGPGISEPLETWNQEQRSHRKETGMRSLRSVSDQAQTWHDDVILYLHITPT